jgi:hypothetical protein
MQVDRLRKDEQEIVTDSPSAAPRIDKPITRRGRWQFSRNESSTAFAIWGSCPTSDPPEPARSAGYAFARFVAANIWDLSRRARRGSKGSSAQPNHQAPKAIDRTVNGTPTRQWAPTDISTPAARARSATTRFAIEPTSVRLPAIALIDVGLIPAAPDHPDNMVIDAAIVNPAPSPILKRASGRVSRHLN